MVRSRPMAVHTLQARQVLASSRQAAWQFFSDPRNLSRITPPDLGFEILTPDLPPHIHPGLMIAYRVRPLLGLRVTWLTEITHVDEGVRFVDEQRLGPYKLWHHEHAFRELGPDRVEMQDRITYVLPFGALGDLMDAWLVRPRLNRIFAFRELSVQTLLALPQRLGTWGF